MPFAEGSVRGYRAETVFHVLQEPERAVAEARRILCPGGRIVLAGRDRDAIMIDSGDPQLTRAILHARADLLSTPAPASSTRACSWSAASTMSRSRSTPSCSPTPRRRRCSRGSPSRPARAAPSTATARTGGSRSSADAGRFLVAIPFFVASASARAPCVPRLPCGASSRPRRLGPAGPVGGSARRTPRVPFRVQSAEAARASCLSCASSAIRSNCAAMAA
ncbi:MULTISPECIES: methyltransferase domain-containing protein [Streptomyces]|uniref:Methyltransferase domain-containing protein n=2 Tax=Streptomyces violaceoruber group TaxID=2867121 RepID=A0ABT4P848_9ACTN|nr:MULTISPECIES: methyltransferase domain-containing protein [Streptomyces]MCW8122611.1 methyltransferase domain-containing protein [Streptomyces anthocyanicus]MCZ4637299.1 methyltransferase domain-containing protein [Streptomyces rubrogriseus]MDX2926745.1 methyltransferase domain-containing protein [Streptomyces sp. NRRL_B-16638]MDX3406913.1 methyltransferase domain-containing protein [Streptomyces sp. ME02-6977A]WMT27359.1 methyltransferase domain-containing protein [Streptomyces coelicolor]